MRQHLEFARDVTPPGHVHALEAQRLADPAITLFSARKDGVLVGIGALKHLDESNAEVKSMHTLSTARGEGVGRALIGHLLAVAARRDYRRVNLETGTSDDFAPARSLYESVGFTRRDPFGDYTANPHSICMSIDLAVDGAPALSKQFRRS